MAESHSFVFTERTAKRWTGRYRRIPGQQSVVHVRWDDTIDLVWQDGMDACICRAIMNDPLRQLARAVNRVKRERTGQAGGAFVINEYGQVICPVADDSGERYYVGECRGAIGFITPDNKIFTLDDDKGLEPGDDWPLPYIGMPYNLSRWDKIYFQWSEEHVTERIFAPFHDRELVRALRRIRAWGGVRFVVNPHGIVLTKTEDLPGYWRPKYVGRINPALWYPKENP